MLLRRSREERVRLDQVDGDVGPSERLRPSGCGPALTMALVAT